MALTMTFTHVALWKTMKCRPARSTLPAIYTIFRGLRSLLLHTCRSRCTTTANSAAPTPTIASITPLCHVSMYKLRPGVGASCYVDGTLATGVYFYTDLLPTYDMDRGDNHSAYVHGVQRRHLIEGSPLRILRCAN